MKRSTESFWQSTERIAKEIEQADAIVIGAGAGLSAASGMEYEGERFHRYFADFEEKYGIADMYSGGFYPFETLEEYWAWWSRHILLNRYEAPVGQPYADLLGLVQDKNYFVITTNVDHQFQKAGFDKKRLFYMQGDYGLFQCSVPCHNKTYGNEEQIRKMAAAQKDFKIPSSLVPHCPHCQAPMTTNLRIDGRFVQDEGWQKAANAYEEFLQKYKDKNILFLELGVGFNTPGIIKYPFWQMTAGNPRARYISISKEAGYVPASIEKQALQVEGDLKQVLALAASWSQDHAKTAKILKQA